MIFRLRKGIADEGLGCGGAKAGRAIAGEEKEGSRFSKISVRRGRTDGFVGRDGGTDLDMDGVLYRGNEPMPRLQEFFAFLRDRSIPFMLVTNNATRTPMERSEQMAVMGVEVLPSEILVSGQAMARYLRREIRQVRGCSSWHARACPRHGG